jgi:hypothetical protein
MTTQEQIRRLARAAADTPSFSRATISPVASHHPVVAGPPFAIRKTPLGTARPPERPRLRSRVGLHQEARMLFLDREDRTNHRRSSRSKPTLAAAVCCLLTSLGALYFNSSQGEETLAGVARAVIQAGDEARMMTSNSRFGP